MSTQSREQIVQSIEKRARREMVKRPSLTPEAARARAWEMNPDLYDRYVAAPAGEPKVEFMKAAPERTLADEILETVQRRADQELWTRWPHASREQLMFETFRDNPSVYDAYRSPQARLPVAEARTQLAKSAEHRGAFDLLRKWASG